MNMNSAQLVEHKAQSDTHENPGVGAEAACRKRMKSMYPKKKKKEWIEVDTPGFEGGEFHQHFTFLFGT